MAGRFNNKNSYRHSFNQDLLATWFAAPSGYFEPGLQDNQRVGDSASGSKLSEES